MHITQWEIARQESVAEQGMVAAKHPLAAKAGLEVLQAGGNAVDAAVTTALTASVVEPSKNGLGGGGFMLYHDASSGQNHFLDYFMPAPQAATPTMYNVVSADETDSLGFQGVKDNANAIGYRSIGVPGMVAGMAQALENFGSISLKKALQPAIQLAENGFDATWYSMLTAAQHMELLSTFPATAQVFLRDGKYIWKTGRPGPTEQIVQKDLAATLRKIAKAGPDGFYRGKVARTIIQDLQAHGNLMTEHDLANYQTRLGPPRVVTYRDRYQLVFGPGTGGDTLAEAFNILEGFDFSGLDPKGTDTLHLFIEAARIAYADRWQHLADETFVDVPWAFLGSKHYAAQRRQLIQFEKAATEVKPWAPDGSGSSFKEGLGGSTSHLSVIDKDHNMVAITQTINRIWGSGVVVPGTGVLFNDTMILFNPMPGSPNSIQGGKRPLSSMAPMLVLKDGKPFLSVGAPGGRLIIGTVMKMLHNVIDFGMGIQEACASISLDCSGDVISVDDDVAPSVVQALRARGHSVEVQERSFLPRPFASPAGILIDQSTGILHGGADPYHPGVTIGY